MHCADTLCWQLLLLSRSPGPPHKPFGQKDHKNDKGKIMNSELFDQYAKHPTIELRNKIVEENLYMVAQETIIY